jgi:hypothetical protein
MGVEFSRRYEAEFVVPTAAERVVPLQMQAQIAVSVYPQSSPMLPCVAYTDQKPG